MPEGSRWWFPVHEGLLAPEHIRKMGPSLPLFLYCLKYATVAQAKGDLLYSHTQASEELGVDLRTINRWFDNLQQYGYVITRRRRPYHLEITVPKFYPVEETADTGSDTVVKRSVINDISHHPKEGALPRDMTRDVTGDVTGMPHLTITNKLISYEDPEGVPSGSSERAVSLASAFHAFWERLKTTPNKQAALRELYLICFGGLPQDAPDYGYLGKLARAVAGAGRLAEIMWGLTAKPPAGDVMAYIMASYSGKGKGRNNGQQHITPADISRGLTPEQEEMNRIAFADLPKDEQV